MTATYRVPCPKHLWPYMDAAAAITGRAERALHADLKRGMPLKDLKRSYLPRFGLNARQFNAIRISLDGKVAAAAVSHKRHLATLDQQIAAIEAKLKSLDADLATTGIRPERRSRLRGIRHQKFRRRNLLADRKAAAVARGPHVVFGGGKLWRAQHELAANGHADHAAWLADWRAARSAQVLLVGSGDETNGNQNAQLTVDADGSLRLTLRVMPALEPTFGPFQIATGIRFPWHRRGNRVDGFRDHGDNVAMADILAALAGNAEATQRRRAREAAQRRGETTVAPAPASPVTIRFTRDDGVWTLFASVQRRAVPVRSDRARGVVAVDLNPKRMDAAIVSADGNLLGTRSCALRHESRASGGQVRASIGDAVAAIVDLAAARGAPVVVEDLDFTNKKRAMRDAGLRNRAMLSGFAYATMLALFTSRCQRRGVELIRANPAYTSLIGCVNLMSPNGLHDGTAAAFALARRALGYHERLPRRLGTLLPPADGDGHVGRSWAALSRNITKLERGLKRHLPRHAWFRTGGAPSPAEAALLTGNRRRRQASPVPVDDLVA